MNKRTVWVSAMVVALLLVVGTAGAMPGSMAPEATVASGINYQGRLTDPGGTALDGTYPMRFQVHDDPTVNSVLWDSGVINVDVMRGLFNVELGVDATDFDGLGLWLRIYVDGEWLTPRQEILPVPYALSLRPGAQIERRDSGNALELIGTATGTALWASSTQGFGVHGYSRDTYAIYGSNVGTTQGKGYGGYFTSNTGIGVYGYSSATRVTDNRYTPGVYGRSANGVGVYGLSDDGDPGVMGHSDGTGVRGWSEHGTGVVGIAEGSLVDEGYGGYFFSHHYRGLYAKSSTTTSYYAGYFQGRDSGSAGIFIDGTLTATGSKSGYVVDVCLNDGPDPLEVGDVVAVVGADEPIIGEIPVMRVRKATDRMASAVVGVVDQRFLMDSAEAESLPHPDITAPSLTEGTGVVQGEYVSIVTLGAFKAIKVDARYGAIQPGDLLVASPNPGHAMHAEDPRTGTVIGKAIGEQAKGTGNIPVLVTIQ
jgi:hypothetical protein